MLVLDEPELGRSEGYTRARGTRPGGQITVMPQETVAMVIVSHSRAMDLALREVVGAPYLCTWASRWTADSSLKCNVRFRTNDQKKATAPIFMALASIDGEDWQSGSNCAKYVEDLAKKGNAIKFKEYKGIYHGFDTNNKFAHYPGVVSSKACDMEVYMTTAQGGGLGNNGFDFKANKALTSYTEFNQAQQQSCGSKVNARAGGDSSAQKEVVRDALSFMGMR